MNNRDRQYRDSIKMITWAAIGAAAIIAGWALYKFGMIIASYNHL